MLDAISSVVSAVAAQSVTAKDEAQTKNTNTASKKQDAKTDKSDAKTAGFSEEAAVYEKSDSKDDSKDTAKSTVNQKMRRQTELHWYRHLRMMPTPDSSSLSRSSESP